MELPPPCSAASRPGWPSARAAQLTERLRDLLTAPEFFDLGQLSIAGGKAVWALYLDVYVIDDDGSLLDVCLLAALAALRALRLPKVEMNKEGSVVLSEDSSEEQPLHLKTLLCALTAGQLDGKLLVDLTSEEEGLVDSKVDLVVDADGNIQGTGLDAVWVGVVGEGRIVSYGMSRALACSRAGSHWRRFDWAHAPRSSKGRLRRRRLFAAAASGAIARHAIGPQRALDGAAFRWTSKAALFSLDADHSLLITCPVWGRPCLRLCRTRGSCSICLAGIKRLHDLLVSRFSQRKLCIRFLKCELNVIHKQCCSCLLDWS